MVTQFGFVSTLLLFCCCCCCCVQQASSAALRASAARQLNQNAPNQDPNENDIIPYIPPTTNATVRGRLNNTLTRKALPQNAMGPFRMRLVWDPEACWQGECAYEIDYCMQCEGFECNDGDILWIELCRNIDQQLFVWIPVNDQDKVDDDNDLEPTTTQVSKKKKKKTTTIDNCKRMYSMPWRRMI
jgi:hypothetical protein